MTKVRRIGVMSLAKMELVLFGVVGLVFALVVFLASLGDLDLGVALLFLVLFTIGSAVAGFVGGALVAWLYNLVARLTGGVEIELAGRDDGEL